jgi:hypothetical protein
MWNRARMLGGAETVIEHLRASWITSRPMDNWFDPLGLPSKNEPRSSASMRAPAGSTSWLGTS